MSKYFTFIWCFCMPSGIASCRDGLLFTFQLCVLGVLLKSRWRGLLLATAAASELVVVEELRL